MEPQPAAFQQLVSTYAREPEVTLVNAAIAHVSGEATLFAPADGTRSELASFDRSLVSRQVAVGTAISELRVPAITLTELLERNAVVSLDLLQIDAEGFDFEIIKMVDFAKWKPRLIHFEHRHLSQRDRLECVSLLTKHGFSIDFSGMDATAIWDGAE